MDGGVLGLPSHTSEEAFTNLIEALRLAESAAKQLAFYRQQSEWILVEHQLGTMRERITALALARV